MFDENETETETIGAAATATAAAAAAVLNKEEGAYTKQWLEREMKIEANL